jgi:L-lactate dehydrogenase complex protein LldG
MTTQDQMLSTIRKALGRSGPLTTPPAPPAIDDALIRVTPAGGDLVTAWDKNASAVGMFIRRCNSAGLVGKLREVLTEIKAKDAAVSVDRLPRAAEIRDAIKAAGVKMIDWQHERSMHKQYEIDAGITDVAAAIVETGSFVCWSSDKQGRAQSLVPPVHIAIVRKSDIVADLADYFSRITGMKGVDLPSAQAIITGPSKTADIEGVLITGVHGPGKVFVLLVEDE